jgi:type IV fimbrial biogenesis protein FimT
MLSIRHSLQRGVTLIELIVTLAILGLLMMAVLPSIGTWTRNTQIRNAAESIQAGLQRARNEAVRRNTPVRFSLVSLTDPSHMDDSCALSATSGSWVVSLADPAGKCSQAPSDTVDPFVVDKHAAVDGGRNTAVNALQADGTTAANSVTFDGFGRVSSAAAIARINVEPLVADSELRSLRIVLTAGGSVRSCDPRVSDTADPRHC